MKQRMFLSFCLIVFGSVTQCLSNDDNPVSLACSFDQNLHGCIGAKNPYSASGNVTVVKYGNNGVAKFNGQDDVDGKERFPWHKSALIFDGVNIPSKGSLSLQVRWNGKRKWADQKRTWLVVVAPEKMDLEDETGEKGTALVLMKENDGSLVLAAYHTSKNKKNIFRSVKSGYDMGKSDKELIKIPCNKLADDVFEPVRIAWDFNKKRVWLTAAGQTKTAECNMKSDIFSCLILGSPPLTQYTTQRGFDGEIDNLVIVPLTPEDSPSAGLVFPKNMQSTGNGSVKMPEAKYLTENDQEKRLEQYTRSHLKNVIEAQKNGGWAYSVALPSKMRFLSSKRVLPMGTDCVACSKEQNSAGAAVRLLAAYDVFGEKQYLDAAEKTADLYLKILEKKGYWVYSVYIDSETGKIKKILNPGLAPFEDHAQSHPVLLMLRLYQLTNKKKYLDAAHKGIDFIYNGQNPNGSWSHHYEIASKCGKAARGYKNAGEINDYTTSDQMKIMLIAYRLTNDKKYLKSYIRAADWLVDAFIDNENVKGWALQYDENNVPIKARHFEPPSVALSEGINSIPGTLINAYRVTGNRKYVDVLLKWKKWMEENRVTSKETNKSGWYRNYDYKTGKPIKMANNKITPADPRSVGDHGYSSLLKKIDKYDVKRKEYIPSPESAKKALMKNASSPDKKYKWTIEYLLNNFDRKHGTWTYTCGAAGKAFSPPTVRILFLCWAVCLNRQLKGQLPWSHPLGKLQMMEWASIMNHVIPPQELYKKLSEEEINSVLE